MLGAITMRSYIMIAVAIAALLFAMQVFGVSEPIAAFIEGQGQDAQAVLPNSIVQGIVIPIVYALTNPVGAIVAGLAWPFLALWFLLYILLTVFAVIVPLFGQAQSTYQT